MSQNAGRRASVCRRVQLRLEHLEDRLVPSADAVTVAGGNLTASFSSSQQNLTLTATVKDTTNSNTIVNEGAVTFTVMQGSTQIGTATPSGTVSNGVAAASFSLPAGEPIGTYSIDVKYSDTPDNFTDNGTDSAGTLTVQNPTTTLVGTTSPVTFSTSDQPVTLSATVTPTSGSGTVNEGTVTFTILQGTVVIGSPPTPTPVSNGSASVTYTLPGGTGVGTYTVEAAYDDNGNTFANSSGTGSLDVASASTSDATQTSATAATASYSTIAQSVTLTAKVTDTINSGTTVNAGKVTFTLLDSNGNPIGTATAGTVTNGIATINNYSLPAGTVPGSYTIEADYNDSTGTFIASSDNTQKLTVSAADTTTTSSKASVGFITGSQSVTLTATVVPKSGSGTVNEGVVTFTVVDSNGNTIGTATKFTLTNTSNGQASVKYDLPAGTPAGSYTIKVAYDDSASSGGSGNFASSDNSSNTSTLTVSAASTKTTAHSATTSFSGSDQDVTLTATVTSTAGTVNEGSVLFTIVDSQGNTIGTAKSGAVSNGQASVSYVVPGGTAAGSYVIEADYSDSGGSFGSSPDHTQTLTIGSASATTVRLTTVSITPSLSNSTAQVTLTVQVSNAAGTVNNGVVTITLAGVTGHGNVSNGTASVQLTVPLGTVSNLVTAGMSYTDASTSGNFGAVSSSATVTTNLLNALLPADLTFDSSGDVQNQLNVAGNTSLLGFSYLASGLLADVLFDSVSLPLTYSNVGGNTVTTFLGAPTAVTFAGSNGQVLGYAKVFFDGTQLQWLLYDANNNPIGEVPYSGLL